jgi:hypothetical protein
MAEGDPRDPKRSADESRAAGDHAPRRAIGTAPPSVPQPQSWKPAPTKPGEMPAPMPGYPGGTIDPDAVLLSSRTATLDDPLTTSLLAEVTRRSLTVDISPEQLIEVLEVDAAEAAADADREPDDPAP